MKRSGSTSGSSAILRITRSFSTAGGAPIEPSRLRASIELRFRNGSRRKRMEKPGALACAGGTRQSSGRFTLSRPWSRPRLRSLLKRRLNGSIGHGWSSDLPDCQAGAHVLFQGGPCHQSQQDSAAQNKDRNRNKQVNLKPIQHDPPPLFKFSAPLNAGDLLY
jgi:hypothetical protein